MRLAVALLLVAATGGCRDDVGHGSRTIRVTAYAGDMLAPNVTVATSAPDGRIIDEVSADAVGVAEIGADPDSLVHVLFGTTAMVTTLAGDETVIHGPSAPVPALVAGVLDIEAPALAGATDYAIDLGCITLHRPSLPASVNVATCNLGTDSALDVLVRAGDAMTAAHVPFSTGSAQVVLPTWETTGTTPSVTLDGVMPALAWTLYADTLPFIDEPLTSSSFAPSSLAIDATRVRATLGASVTDRYGAGIPTTLAFGPADFLPPITAAARADLTYTWQPVPGVDAVALHVDFPELAWDVILPPDATSVHVPQVVTVSAPSADAVTLRAVDSDKLDGFSAVLTAGVWSDGTVDKPAVGEIRTTTSSGLQ